MTARLYIGASGWSYPDWEGVFYPAGAGKALDRLGYYAGYFDAVEINTTFYGPPKPDYARKWLDAVAANPRFVFTAKLWRRFTHERAARWSDEEVELFMRGIEPLAAAGKLGALLVQFPWSFKNAEPERRWLAELSRAFADYPKVVEVRHASWLSKPAINYFGALGLNFCNIDQPNQRDSIGPTGLVTGPIGYCRFHGRNAENWFKKGADRNARYDYLYSGDELQPWLDNIEEMAQRIEQIYVMSNNHYRGQAPVNALQMRAALGGGKTRVPASLIEHYPVLEAIAE